MKTILIGLGNDRFYPEFLQEVQALAPDYRVLHTQDRAEIETVIDEIEIVAGDLPRALLPQAKNLRWMQQWGAGVDWLMRHPEAADLPFVLTNASGVHAIPITEHIFAFLLNLGRAFHRSMRAQVRHEWAKIPGEELFEVWHKTMVLVGVGAIGAQTAKLAEAMEMHVIGVRRDPSESVPGVARMVGPDQLLAVLPEADFVVITLPLTHETEGMVGARELPRYEAQRHHRQHWPRPDH